MFKQSPLLLLLGLALPATAVSAPALMQGVEVGDDLSLPTDLAQWMISEKYDGVRAYWDGTQLLTRSGYPIQTPDGFTHGWPAQHLEGELWIDYAAFSTLSALVRSHDGSEQAWHPVRFMLFDLPQWPGTFAQRHARLRQLLLDQPQHNLQLIEQRQGTTTKALEQQLEQVIDKGGEGLMLHRAGALHQLQRTTDIRKLKPFQDADAVVVAHLPGKGKYTGQLGSLLVERSDGSRFRIGSGFSDRERAHPPALGSTITYRYNGLTRHGKPRFARFLRVRPD
ncbi:DNA ligase [Marinobacterium marinum]|uniref:DNA ligase n=1 Tax=Marinobacterium marinum TaxID=2756129 RepID=A0A7W2ACB7_9GAMM|nr:DNA ligase [Marinobacterium marinum]MBA4502965.1 DNA ligase [Marinobacterium marinum]